MRLSKLWIVALFLALWLSGCGGTAVTSTGKAEPGHTAQMPPSEVPADKKVYGVGERAVIDGEYALTIIGVTETKERNQFSDKAVAQVLIIDYQYENLALEERDVYISDMDFKFVDSGGNMCDTYPVSGPYSPCKTPLAARTLASMTVGTVEKSDSLRILFYDNIFASEPTAEFLCKVDQTTAPVLEGESIAYEGMYGLGDVVEVKTTNGDYRLSIDQIEVVTERNPFSDKKPAAVYRVVYTYSNTSVGDGLYISDMDFVVVDSEGNTGYTYPGDVSRYPQETIKGAKCTAEMVFGVHRQSNSLILCYRDNMFSDKADIFFRLPVE